jgi:hypothetical protein
MAAVKGKPASGAGRFATLAIGHTTDWGRCMNNQRIATPDINDSEAGPKRRRLQGMDTHPTVGGSFTTRDQTAHV